MTLAKNGRTPKGTLPKFTVAGCWLANEPVAIVATPGSRIVTMNENDRPLDGTWALVITARTGEEALTKAVTAMLDDLADAMAAGRTRGRFTSSDIVDTARELADWPSQSKALVVTNGSSRTRKAGTGWSNDWNDKWGDWDSSPGTRGGSANPWPKAEEIITGYRIPATVAS